MVIAAAADAASGTAQSESAKYVAALSDCRVASRRAMPCHASTKGFDPPRAHARTRP